MEFISSKAAFIAVDLQRAFCSDDGSVAKNGRDITGCKAAAARCLELAGAAHDAGIPVIWTRFVLRPDYADGGVLVHEMRPWIRDAGSLMADTPDIELVPGADVAPEDFVIDKQRYSSFYATGLELILRSLSVECLMVVGKQFHSVRACFRGGCHADTGDGHGHHHRNRQHRLCAGSD